MAEQIIARWKLAVLRVTLDLSRSEPAVSISMHSFPDDVEVQHWSRSVPLADFGVPSTGEVPDSLGIPMTIVDEITETVHDLRITDPETSLWLRLEPPYGYLGAAPWETLGAMLGIPVLRVPDRLPVPARLGRIWRVAIVASAPTKAGWAADHVRAFATALRERGCEAEVFADANVFEKLTAAGPLPDGIRVHDPGMPTGRSPVDVVAVGNLPGVRTIESEDDPRLLWSNRVLGGLGERGVSAIHIAATGRVTPDRAGVGVAADPTTKGRRTATIEAEDLWVIADAAGASLMSIAAPEADGPDIGARVVADRLGQLRPGPTVFDSISNDPGSQGLAEVHGFFASTGDRMLPPGGTRWFGYIQPDSATDVLDVPSAVSPPSEPPADEEPLIRAMVSAPPPAPAAPPQAPGSGSTADDIAALFADDDTVPRWVSSSSRVLQSQQADLMSSVTDDGSASTVKQAYDRGAQAALADIEALVKKHVGRS